MKKIIILSTLLFTTLVCILNSYTITKVEANDYYSGIDTTDSLSEFNSELSSLITRTHNYKAYGSSYNAVLARGAAISPGSSEMTLFYTGHIDTASNAGGGNVNDWNKEHVWPKSQTGGENSQPANDIHNIRPTNTKINSTRSNLPFGEDFGGNVAYAAVPYAEGSTYCYYGNGKFEPRDEVKGDCARIIFYLLTRYDNLDVSTVGNMDMFLRWHYEDPVDTYEININDEIYEFQGNRIPYIDHPEYVDKMYPNDYGVSFEELDHIILPTEAYDDIHLQEEVSGYQVTWTSNNSAMTNTGVITPSTEDITVKLTASITKEGKVGSKDFYVVVKARVLTPVEAFTYSTIKNALEVEYTDNSVLEDVTASTGEIDNTGASGNFLNLTKGVNYAKNFGLNEDELFLTLENSGTGNGVSFYKTDTLTLNANSIVKLSSLAGNIKSVKVTYSAGYTNTSLSTTTTGGTVLINNVAQVINSKDVYLIQNASQGRIEAMEIVYETGVTSYDVTKINYNFGLEIDKAAYDILSADKNFEMGLLYINEEDITGTIISNYNNENINTFISNKNLTKVELTESEVGTKLLFTTTLNIDKNQSIKAVSYVVYEGTVYFNKEVNRSVCDVINIYVTDHQNNAQVTLYIDLLKYILNN